jgi:hypothetical protein
MMNRLVILHGWGDNLATLQPLSRALAQCSGQPTTDIFLGEYVSLDNDIRMTDLVVGLDRAWHDKNLDSGDKVNVVAYSTGALIIRDWLYTYYTQFKKTCSIANLVMLAPANFGSPLAHKGNSFICRVTKGFNSEKFLETGKFLLDALEMASPYSWELAEKDRFVKNNPFTPKDVRTTVIVGNKGHGGIKSIGNSLGSDGTVYTCTASMKTALLTLDYSDTSQGIKSKFKTGQGNNNIAFLTLDGFNHTTIAHKKNDACEGENIDAILNALKIESDEAFKKWLRQCESKTNKILKQYRATDQRQKHGFQNTVFRVKDHEGNWVKDYLIEFYADESAGDDDDFCEIFNTDVVTKVHVNKNNPSYRSLLINCHLLEALMKTDPKPINIRISAAPDIDRDRNHVGYKSMTTDEHSSFLIEPSDVPKYFKPNRTLFIDITLERIRKASVLTLNPMSDLPGS